MIPTWIRRVAGGRQLRRWIVTTGGLSGCAGPDRFGVDCQTVESSADTVVPAYSESRRHCIFQSDLLLFSCAGAHQSLKRICPCRDYMKGQVALCKSCL